MPVTTITVAGKGSFTCQDGDTVLAAGLRAGYGFPKACRNGNCGRCAGKLLDGEVQLRDGTRLRAGQPGSEQTLFCIAEAITDCCLSGSDITAPGELPLHTLSCQIRHITALNHNVSAVTLLLPAGQAIRWYAGQYLLLGEKQDAAFSIANAWRPGQREIQLHIRHDDDNASAVALMELLRTSVTIGVTLPLGERYLEALPSQPVWFICGSTGFAPARAMIEQLALQGFDLPVRLFRGGRQPADIYPANWQTPGPDNLADFTEVLALSEGNEAGFFHGMVHEAALAQLRDPAEPMIHVGGSPAMAWAVFDALRAAGVPAEHIHSDVFDYAPRSA